MSSSANFRRIISRKRNALALLLSDADEIIDRDITTLTSGDLVKLSNRATRLKADLSSTHNVVSVNAMKWLKLIETIEDNQTKQDEEKELMDYFEDTDNNRCNSVESIHESTSTRQELLDSVLTNVDRALSRLSLTSPPRAEQSVDSNSQPVALMTHAALVPLPTLPNLTVPSFDGKGAWETFWKVFQEIIDVRTDIGDSTKLRYLECSLEGEASDLFSHLLKRGCEYKGIVTGLQNEYQSKAKNCQHLISEFATLCPKDNSFEEQLGIIRSFETLIAQLKIQKADPNDTPHCLHNVLQRLSSYCQKLVHIKMREIDDSSTFSLSDALSFLKCRLKEELEIRELCPPRSKAANYSDSPICQVSAEVVNTIEHPKNVTETKEEDRQTPLKSSADNVAGAAQMCIFCNTHPNSFACYSMKQIEKRNLLTKQFRCWICFQHGHPADQRSQPVCGLCEGNHNFSVCYSFRFYPSEITDDEDPSDETEENTDESASDSE